MHVNAFIKLLFGDFGRQADHQVVHFVPLGLQLVFIVFFDAFLDEVQKLDVFERKLLLVADIGYGKLKLKTVSILVSEELG